MKQGSFEKFKKLSYDLLIVWKKAYTEKENMIYVCTIKILK